MFEQLFGSKTRAELIKFFLNNPAKCFYVRELTRNTKLQLNSVRRELQNLLSIKLILEEKNKQSVKYKYYRLNPNSVLIKDLTLLFSKGRVLVEDRFVKRIASLGEIKYFALAGRFVDDKKSPTDLIIVGDGLDCVKLERRIKKLEKDINRELKYTILDLEEYNLRQAIADQFLQKLLENPNNIIVINHLGR